MKILVLTPRFPHPLDKGDRLRAYHHLRLLAADHDVGLCALAEKPVAAESLAAVRRWCRRVEIFRFNRFQGRVSGVSAVARGLPFQVGYFTHRRAVDQFRRMVADERPDAVFLQLVRTAEYAVGLDRPCVIDYMDAFSSGMAQRASVGNWRTRSAYALEHRLLRKYERRSFGRFDAHTVISERDRAALDVADRERVLVMPNGVDTSAFAPRIVDPSWDILFVGNMAYPPNVLAAKTLVHRIVPLVRRRRPGVRVLLAGANPVGSVRRLAGRGVEVSGWVDDVAGCYAASRVFVAPMELSTGMQNKLLQAMAMGRPCVTTPLAVAALGIPDDVMRVGTDMESLADETLDLLEHPEEAERLGRKGREWVVDRGGWEGTAGFLNQAIERAVASRRGSEDIR